MLPRGTVRVAWAGEGRTTELSRQAQGHRLVHAGLVGVPQSASLGGALVGCRVRVFWVGEDRLYSGEVRAFNRDTGQHTVAYDDGDIVEGALGEIGGDFPFFLC